MVILDRFSGGDPEDWIFRAERYFIFRGFSKKDWLFLTYLYLDGDAWAWFDWLYRNNQFWDWKHFTEKLIMHFRKRDIVDPIWRPAVTAPARGDYVGYPISIPTEASVSSFAALSHNSNLHNFASGKSDTQQVFNETLATASPSIHSLSTVSSIPYLQVLELHASDARVSHGDKSTIDEDKVFDGSPQSTTTAVKHDDILELYISPVVDKEPDFESLNKHTDFVDAIEALDCKAKSMQEETDSNTIPVPNGVAHPKTLGPTLSNGQVFDKISRWSETCSLIRLQLAGTRTTFKYVLDPGGELLSIFNQLLLVKDYVTRFPFDPGADLLIVNLDGPATILGVNFKPLSLTGHTEYMQAVLLLGFVVKLCSFAFSNSTTKVWDPGQKWYLYSYILQFNLILAVTSPAFHHYYNAEKDPSSDLKELEPGATVLPWGQNLLVLLFAVHAEIMLRYYDKDTSAKCVLTAIKEKGVEVSVDEMLKLFDQKFQKADTRFARTSTCNMSYGLILTINKQIIVELNDFQVDKPDCPHKVANLFSGEHKTKAGDLFDVVVITAFIVLLQLTLGTNMPQLTRVLRETTRSDYADNIILWLYRDFGIHVYNWLDRGHILEVGSFCSELFINNSRAGICAKYEWWYEASNDQFYLNYNRRNGDALGGSLYFVGNDDEIINTVKTCECEDKAGLEQKIGEMDSRLDKLKKELRKVVALEIVLYSVVSKHGSSVYQLHAPAKNFSRLYLYACNYWCLDKRATVAKNIVSGLVLVSIILGGQDFQEALKRLCPVVNEWVMEQCVVRLDGAKFNMFFHELACAIPAAALYLIVDSRVLHIPTLCFATLLSYDPFDSRFFGPIS
ncbi:hypothetical protein A4A49_20900 [Nicotiana attenuata]|uniref:Uncharacterized protein n=1 Tax=Nicotiana attenuata TaxID=49451 RepID=A0A1J6IJ25_NICAT|nr:hypothetical protein A4A49_20900 [Nicotiana attenuata]